MVIEKYGELRWNQKLERTDLYLDSDLMEALFKKATDDTIQPVYFNWNIGRTELKERRI